jgi:hypothetical protein
MLAVASQIEALWSLNKGVGFQSYRLFKGAIPILPWPALMRRNAGGGPPDKKKKKR